MAREWLVCVLLVVLVQASHASDAFRKSVETTSSGNLNDQLAIQHGMSLLSPTEDKIDVSTVKRPISSAYENGYSTKPKADLHSVTESTTPNSSAGTSSNAVFDGRSSFESPIAPDRTSSMLQQDRTPLADQNLPALPITADDAVSASPNTTPDTRLPKTNAPDSKNVYFVEGVSDKEPVAIVGAPLSDSVPRTDRQQRRQQRQQRQRGEEQQRQQQQASELLLVANDANHSSRENKTKLAENAKNPSNENRNSSAVEAERDQTQDAIREQHNLKTKFSSHRKPEPSLGANTEAGTETGAVAIPVMHFGGQRFIEFGVVRTQKGPQVLKNHILTKVVLANDANEATKRVTNLIRSRDLSKDIQTDRSKPPKLVPLTSTIEESLSTVAAPIQSDEFDATKAPAAFSSAESSSTSDASFSSSSQETESSESSSEDAVGCRKDKSRRKRKVTKPKPVPATLASVFEFKRLTKKKSNSNSLLPKTLAETRATESAEDQNVDNAPLILEPGSLSSVTKRPKTVKANDDFLQNVLRNFGVQVEIVPVANSTNATTNDSPDPVVVMATTTPAPSPTVSLLPIIPPVQSLSQVPKESDILQRPSISLLRSKPPRLQIKVPENELSVLAAKPNFKNRSNAKSAAVNSLGHEVSDAEKGFTSSTKSSRQGLEVPTIPPTGSSASSVSNPPTETFTIDLNKIRENKRKGNKPKTGSVELTPGKVYIHDLESATFEEAPDEDGTLARNLEARKKYEDDFVKNILQNYGIQLDSKTGKTKSEFVSSEAPSTAVLQQQQDSLPPQTSQRPNVSPDLLPVTPQSHEQLPQQPLFLHEASKFRNAFPATSSELPSARNVPLRNPVDNYDSQDSQEPQTARSPEISSDSRSKEELNQDTLGLQPIQVGGPLHYADRSKSERQQQPLNQNTIQYPLSNEAIRIVPAPNLAGLQPRSPILPSERRQRPLTLPVEPDVQQFQQQQPLPSASLDGKYEQVQTPATDPRCEPLNELPQPLSLQQPAPTTNQNGLDSREKTVHEPSQQVSPQYETVSQSSQSTGDQSQNLPEQQVGPRLPSADSQQTPIQSVDSPPQNLLDPKSLGSRFEEKQLEPPQQIISQLTPNNVQTPSQLNSGEQQRSVSGQVPVGQEYFHPHVQLVDLNQLHEARQQDNSAKLQQEQHLQPQSHIPLQQQHQAAQAQQQLQTQNHTPLQPQPQAAQTQVVLTGDQVQQRVLPAGDDVQQQAQQYLQAGNQSPHQQQQIIQTGDQVQHQQPHIPQAGDQVQQQVLPAGDQVQQQPQQYFQGGDQVQHQQQQIIQAGDQVQQQQQQFIPAGDQVQQQLFQAGDQVQQQQQHIVQAGNPVQQQQQQIIQAGDPVQQQQQQIYQVGDPVQQQQQQIFQVGDPVQQQQQQIFQVGDPVQQQQQQTFQAGDPVQQQQQQILQAGDPVQQQEQQIFQAGDPAQQQQQQIFQAGDPVQQKQQQLIQAGDPVQQQQIFHAGDQVQQQIIQAGDPVQQQPQQLLQGQQPSGPEPVQYLPQQQVLKGQQIRVQPALPDHQIQPSQPLPQADIPLDQQLRVEAPRYEPLPDVQRGGVESLNPEHAQLQGPAIREISYQQQPQVQQQHVQLSQQQIQVQQQEPQLPQQQFHLSQQQEIQLLHQQGADASQQQQQQQDTHPPQQQISLQDQPQQVSQYQPVQLTFSQTPQIASQPNLFRAAHSVSSFPNNHAITVPTFEVQNGRLRSIPTYGGRTKQLRIKPSFTSRQQIRPLPLKESLSSSTQSSVFPFGGFQVTHFGSGNGATAFSSYRPDSNGLLSNVFSQSFNPSEGTSSTFRLNFGYRNRETPPNGKQFDSLFSQFPNSQRISRFQYLDSQKRDLFRNQLLHNQGNYLLGSTDKLVSNVNLQSNGANEYTGYIKKASRRKSR